MKHFFNQAAGDSGGAACEGEADQIFCAATKEERILVHITSNKPQEPSIRLI